MKKLTLVFLPVFMLCSLASAQQSAAVTEKYFGDPEIRFNTPTLSINEDRFASHAEVMEWIKQNIEGKPGAEVQIIGKSGNGLAIPLIYLRRPGQDRKLKLWFQGVLHGNEPAGAEGLLYLASRLLDDPSMSGILDRVDVAILPVANWDGYVAMERRSAGGIDLNRDQTKYADPVSRIIRKAFIGWEPDIAYDIHEFQPTRSEFADLGESGASISYDVKFLPSGYLNIPGCLRRASLDIFQAGAEKALDRYGYTHCFYFTADVSGEEMILKKGAQSPQSSSTSYALSNAVSMLVEVRGIGLGRTSLGRRTHAVYLVAESCLKSAVTHENEIREILNEAREKTIAGKEDIVVLGKPAEKFLNVRFIDLQTTGIIEKRVKVLDALEMSPVLVRSRPEAYILEAGTEREMEILKLLGLKLEPVEKGKKYSIESYQVTEYEEAKTLWEKIRPVTVKVVIQKEKRKFPEGAWYLDLAQKNANYAVSLLEPESPNGFVSFRVTETGPGQKLKIHRLTR